MSGKKKQPSNDFHLRPSAAAAMLEGGQPHRDVASMSQDEMNQTVHELRTHQVELELQNDELRRMQLELETIKERYFDLYDQAPVGYVTVDETGLILEANLTAASLLGTARGALTGSPVSRFVFREDQDIFYQYRRRLFEAGGRQICELRMLGPDGAPSWVNLEAAAAQDPDGHPVARMMMSDISERRTIEEEQRLLGERLRQTQRLESLGVLAAGIAHNFNNLMTIIMGTASMHEVDATDPADLEAYGTILKACERGRGLVQSLTHFANPALASNDPVNLNMLIEETCSLLVNAAGNHIEIIKVLPEASSWFLGDAGSFSTILMNVCLNSLDAMPGGGTLTFRVTVPARDWVEVSIEDTGEGMTPEVLAHATEPFFTTKPTGKGTGLGLSMTHGVVTAHGGTLEIASAAGRGTQVKFRLPMIPAPAGEQPAAAPVPPLTLTHVLLVDDDEDVRCLMARMLRKAGVPRIATVPGGREALDYLQAGDLPEVIILDQNMPGMDGVQTLARVRALHPALPVLISSGHLEVREWACFRQPWVAVIQKPFSMQEVLDKLAQFAKGLA